MSNPVVFTKALHIIEHGFNPNLIDRFIFYDNFLEFILDLIARDPFLPPGPHPRNLGIKFR
jgi:hypothetical protein